MQSVGRSRISSKSRPACWWRFDTNSRKVRAPWAELPDNTWALRNVRNDGKCHRNQTAATRQRAVRVKRWGKSPPHPWQHGWHGKPQLEQGQASGERCHLDKDAAGRPLEGASDCSPREMIVTMETPSNRTRLIDRLPGPDSPLRENRRGLCYFQLTGVNKTCAIASLLVAAATTSCARGPRAAGPPFPSNTPAEAAPNEHAIAAHTAKWSFHRGSTTMSYHLVSTTTIRTEPDTSQLRDTITVSMSFSLAIDTAGLNISGILNQAATYTGIRENATPVLSLPTPVTFAGSISQAGIDLHPSALTSAEIPCSGLTDTWLTRVKLLLDSIPSTVQIGMSWRDSTNLQVCQGSIPIELFLIRHYRVAGETTKLGQQVVLIERSDSTQAIGQGIQGQHQVSIESRGEGGASLFLDIRTGSLITSDYQHSSTVIIRTSGSDHTFRQQTGEKVSLIR